MSGLILVILILLWPCGRMRGVVGGLAGGFLGALVMVGMARTVTSGEIADLYSPLQLVSAVGPVTLVGGLLALVAPYATGVAALGWATGALLAALAAPRTGQAAYILPFTIHALAAAAVTRLAMWSARTSHPSTASTAAGSARNPKPARATRRHEPAVTQGPGLKL